jgi:hypothetical protein
MTLAEIFIILGVHWLADFVCQSELWALRKSKSVLHLLSHTLMYSFIWLIVFTVYGISSGDLLISIKGIAFVTITFLAHTATDYVTSKVVAKRFADNKLGSPIPNFGAFTIIGFDQLLHYAQLFLTYQYLFK